MSVFRKTAVLTAFLLPAACGGGGGGSDPQPVVMPSTLQGPNEEGIYEVSNANLLIDPTTGAFGDSHELRGESNSTVTVTTDANGQVSQYVLNIENLGFSTIINQTYTNVTGGNSISLNELATAIRAASEGAAGTSRFLLGTENLSYAAFGGWAYNVASNDFRMGMLAGGNETDGSTLPASGVATYTGTTLGAGYGAGGETFAFRGDAELVVDFAAQSVATTFSNLVTQNVATGAMSSLPDLSGSDSTGSIVTGPDGKHITSFFSAGGYTVSVDGAFYGPSAEEVAGTWVGSDDTTSLIGSFGARQ